MDNPLSSTINKGSRMKKILLLITLAAIVLPARMVGQEKAVTTEDLEEVKGALKSQEESAAEYRGYVDALRKIKITGYIQPQWRITSNMPSDYPSLQRFAIGGFNGGAFPENSRNLFQVRRGRIKVNYDNALTQFVIQIDAIQTGFTTKDAYLSVTEPWTKSIGLQMGIFDRPFGYEISYSSSNRETPERSRLFQTLFPGERELGGKLFFTPQTGPLHFLHADVGVFNGSGPTGNEFDSFKDIIGRVGAQVPMDDIGAALDFDVSGYFGKVRNDTKFLYTPGDLPNGTKGYIVDSTASNKSAGVDRQYIGFDAQFYLDVPMIGGLILRGEYIFGKQPSVSSTSVSPGVQPPTPIYKRDFAGYYVYLIQNIGNRNQLVVKYDVYDPNSKVSGSDFTATNTSGASGLTATDVKYTTWGFGLVHHWDDNVKFMLYYELVQNEKLSQITSTASPLYLYSNDVKDNVFTFRVQYKF
jgi:hypothetical protein